MAGAPLPSSSALAWNSSLLCADVGCDFHVTLSCLRAELACHQLSATIATPGATPVRFCGFAPSTMKACFTPGSVLIWSIFAASTLAPYTGAF